MRAAALLASVAVAACGSSPESPAAGGIEPPAYEPPVVMNPEPPVEYPADLYRQRIEGSVILRLYISADGAVVPESTQVAEGSGNDLLDSAAVAGVVNMRFAPARQNGEPVATAFLQPIHFRHPEGSLTGMQP